MARVGSTRQIRRRSGELRAAIEAMWHEALGGVAAALDEDREK